MEIHDRLRSLRVTGVMAAFFSSLFVAVAFGIPWALDDGTWNQPYPKGLRKLVVAAAAVHFGSLGYRLLKAVWTWEPLGPILGRLLGGYGLLAVTGACIWILQSYRVQWLAHLFLTLPAGWGCYLLATAITPSTPEPEPHRESVPSGMADPPMSAPRNQ